MKIIHGNGYVRCPWCGKTRNTVRSLQRHKCGVRKLTRGERGV